MPGTVRRVVTGHDAAGKGVVVADGPADDIAVVDGAGLTINDMWPLSTVPTRLDAWERQAPGAPMSIVPPPGGLNFRVLRFDPVPAGADMDGESVLAGMGQSDAHVRESRHPAMHRTETVDFGIVLSGSITLMLDEDDVTLAAGDVVIQRGTSHAWENRGDEPCTVAFVVVDAAATAAVDEAATAAVDAAATAAVDA